MRTTLLMVALRSTSSSSSRQNCGSLPRYLRYRRRDSTGIDGRSKRPQHPSGPQTTILDRGCRYTTTMLPCRSRGSACAAWCSADLAATGGRLGAIAVVGRALLPRHVSQHRSQVVEGGGTQGQYSHRPLALPRHDGRAAVVVPGPLGHASRCPATSRATCDAARPGGLRRRTCCKEGSSS